MDVFRTVQPRALYRGGAILAAFLRQAVAFAGARAAGAHGEGLRRTRRHGEASRPSSVLRRRALRSGRHRALCLHASRAPVQFRPRPLSACLCVAGSRCIAAWLRLDGPQEVRMTAMRLLAVLFVLLLSFETTGAARAQSEPDPLAGGGEPTPVDRCGIHAIPKPKVAS